MRRGERDERIRERIQVVTSGEPGYPALLKEIKDYPKTLYYIGRQELMHTRCTAVVGSRTTTSYGRNTARAIGRTLAQHGITVVSGMAAGIDTCGHEGALEEADDTIAVLGCGPDVCYPPENLALRDIIARRGLILSEYEPGTAPMPYQFPLRNRIISGLSELIVVVQARSRSGALITAELAAEQGREICAVPGNIDSQYNLGTNQLIRDGAGVLTTAGDVLELLGLSAVKPKQAEKRLTGTEYSIWELLSQHGEMSADEICLRLTCQPGYVLPVLSALELKGFVCSAAGKFFLAKP